MIFTGGDVKRMLTKRASELHASKRNKASYFVYGVTKRGKQISRLRKVLGDEGYIMKIGNTKWKATEVKK